MGIGYRFGEKIQGSIAKKVREKDKEVLNMVLDFGNKGKYNKVKRKGNWT